MNSVKRAILGVVVILVSIMLFALIIPQVDNVFDVTNTFADTENVTTPVGVSTGNMTLSRPLYNGDVGSVTLTSSIVETPVADNYTASDRKLYINSMTANTTRNMTAAYSYPSVSAYTGTSDFLLILPLLVLLGLMGFGGWAVYSGVRSNSSRRRR